MCLLVEHSNVHGQLEAMAVAEWMVCGDWPSVVDPNTHPQPVIGGPKPGLSGVAVYVLDATTRE